jgi:pimeloyl-ACP methyl ester carboxylesterase
VAQEEAADRVMDMEAGPTSRVYFSQRLRMHYVDWGNPEAPPLVLLHGGRDHCRNWDWVAADLRRDYHVIAPDLRGHGDSAWSAAGHYTMANYIYDLAQLIHQQGLAPVTIIAHSLGGNIALRYSGIYPENVRRIVAIEGLGPGPGQDMVSDKKPMAERMRYWIEATRGISGRQPRRYPTVEAAYARMQAENKHLTPEQARHLTQHAVNQNEDGTYSWKFDHYVRLWPPYDMSRESIAGLWGAITCKTMLVYGKESWAKNPADDGRLAYFKNARVLGVEKAGHWVHHDQLAFFLGEVRGFLAEA